MKNIVLIFVVILISSFTLVSCAMKKYVNSPPPKSKNIITKTNKNSNYIKANEWMINTFSNAESVIQFSDKEAGIIKGKYAMKASAVSTSQYNSSSPAIYAIITIRVRDQESRIEITPPSSGLYTAMYDGKELGFSGKSFNDKASALINEFTIYMSNSSTNDNW